VGGGEILDAARARWRVQRELVDAEHHVADRAQLSVREGPHAALEGPAVAHPSFCDTGDDAALTPRSPVAPASAVQDNLHVGFAGKLAPQIFPEARLITRDDEEVTVRQLPVFHGCLPAVISHPGPRVKNPRGDGAPAEPRALPSTVGAGSRACWGASVARLRRRPSSSPSPLPTLGGIHRRR